MQIKPQEDVEILEEIEQDTGQIDLWELVVFNDDVNSFDHVITTLIEVCDHTPEQAEQCTIIIHFKGKCGVKSGEFEELASLRQQITKRGISAEVMLK